jgi:hypothetical protein
MPERDGRAAARERDSGMRKISQLTWRAGAAGVVLAAVIAVAFTHHADASASQPKRQHGQGSIVIPAQPPQPTGGFGQVTSGAS